MGNILPKMKVSTLPLTVLIIFVTNIFSAKGAISRTGPKSRVRRGRHSLT